MTAVADPQYPQTERDDVVETVHGEPIADPYRWLEDPDSPRTRAWVAEQNAVTEAHLATLPQRSWFSAVVGELVGQPRAGVPVHRAGRYLVSRNDGSQDQDRVYVAGTLAELVAGGRLLLDPAEFDPDGKVAVSGIGISPDGRWLSYGLNEAGSDWTSWRLREIDTGVDAPDRVVRSKFCTAEWLPDSGSFLYWAYPEQERTTGDDATALGTGALLRHRLGTDQRDDEVVYHDPSAPRERATAEVTQDGQWLVLTIVQGTARRNRVAVHRIGSDGTLGPRLDVVPAPAALYEPAGADGDLLYLRTYQGASRYRLVAVDLATLAWREVVPERAAVLSWIRRAGDGFLAVYLDDAAHRVYRLARDGTTLGEVDLGGGPVAVLSPTMSPSVRAGEAEAFIGVMSLLTDVRPYRVDLATGSAEPSFAVESRHPVAAPVVTERRYATSADGTAVPYFLVRRSDLPAGTSLPTLLYGYGGFNQAITPAYRVPWPAWVAAGGVLAVANLRGGGEYGHQWYEAGTRERKQNVFDDFVAVAEDLVGSGVTTSGQLAVHGRSNGGLLIGALMTQRPELAAVALPAVGTLDMLRFHKFTIGWAWIPDFGDPEVAEDFAILRAYSPLHNLLDGTRYPATLVLTGDHDDRVVPAHSYKFTAALQHAQAGPAPVLARIETATGHGVGKPASMVIAETADLLAFAAAHTGLTPKGA